jgi:subtilase family serine protease
MSSNLKFSGTPTVPSVGILGTSFDWSYTVINDGTDSTTSINPGSDWYDQIWFSTDQVLDADDRYLYGSSYLPALGAGQTYSQSGSTYLQSSYTPGAGYLLFKTDAGNWVQGESNENDNLVAVPFTIQLPDVDLKVKSATITSATAVTVGSSVAATVTIENTGAADSSSATYTRFYLSKDNVFDGADINAGDTYTALLTANSEVELNTSFYIPTDVAAGTYYVFAIADNNNNQLESNETNNALLLSQQIQVGAPDFSANAISAPSSAGAGSQITVNWTVSNNSAGTGANNYIYDVFYISDDAILDPYDLSLGASYEFDIESGETYSKSINLTLPSDLASGTKYLLVAADGYNYYTEGNETDNIKSTQISIVGADVDLTASATAPTGVLEVGQYNELNWKVTNLGTTGSRYSYSFVYLSDDAVFDTNDRYISGAYTPAIDAGQSVDQTIGFYPTINDVGSKYLLFVADSYNNVSETDSTNNIAAVAVTIGAPDFQITAASAPTTLNAGDNVSISWTVTNNGTAPARNLNYGWYDQVYISDDDVLDNTDTYLAFNYTYSSEGDNILDVGESYTVTQNATIPSTGTGGRYLIFQTDGGNWRTELNENNNTYVIPINTDAADLQVTSATTPSSAALGETVNLTWTVQNKGGTAANADWYDAFYISDDATLDSSDVFIGDRWAGNETPLAAAGSYTVSQDVTLPGSITQLSNSGTGAKYLLIKTDSYANRQTESDENNNVIAKAITLSAPDLTISTSTTPINAIVGQTLSLAWTVTNSSTTTPAKASWWDGIYLSDDAVFDSSDRILSDRWTGNDTPLAAGASYAATRDINLDASFPTSGSKYILFVADYYFNRQGETNENNNVASVQVNFSAPDLTITANNSPTSAVLGQTLSLSWTVKNAGSVSANADWYDEVFVSDDAIWDSSDIGLGLQWTADQTPLAANGTYTVTRDYTVGSNIPTGSKYLIYVTDRLNYQGETNENNNYVAKQIEISATDLQVTAATAPTTATLGESIAVSWTVSNTGTTSAPADWYDAIYVSDDMVFDSSDTFVSKRSAADNTPLAAGGSYTATENVTVPITGLGNRYLLFVADKGYWSWEDNLQGETNETNNTKAVAINLTAPDLIVDEATVSQTSAKWGDTVSVSWKVKNQGTVTAPSDWYDSVYLSTDNVFDSSDVFLTKRSAADASPLAPGASYTSGIQDFILPNSIGEGARYLLFVTDKSYLSWEDNLQGETNETNNVKAVAFNVVQPKGTFSFSNSSFTIKEDGTAVAAVTINRTNSTSGAASVVVNLSDSSATSPADYTNSPITVNFADGESSRVVTIPIVNDQIIESTEYLNLSLSNPSTGANLGSQTTATLLIEDDDVQLAFTRSDYTLIENGTPIEAVTITRTGRMAGTVGATLNLTNGTAVAPGDFNSTPLTITFAENEFTKTIAIPVIDDSVVEDSETLTLSLTGGTGGATIGGTSTATLTILDNETRNLTGTDGADTIRGAAGNDDLKGGAGRDTILGGYGDDILVGGLDADTLTGGAGRDKFVYTSIREGRDTITDFTVGEDQVVLTQLFQSLGVSLNFATAISGGYLGFTAQGTDAVMMIDSDGTAGRNRALAMAQFQGVSTSALNNASNFVF